MSLEEIIDKIVSKTNLSKAEIEELIKNKTEELGGFVTEEGAANIVATELGIDLFQDKEFEEIKFSIEDISLGMTNVSVTGRVTRIYSPRTFEREGQKGAVVDLVIADLTGEIPLVLWDEHVRYVTENEIKKGDIVKVVSGYVKEGLDKKLQLNLGRRGRIIINPPDVNKKDFPELKEIYHSIFDLKPGMRDIDVVGVVQTIYDLNVYEKQDGTEGKVFSLFLKDKSGTCRTVFWDNQADEFFSSIKPEIILKIEGGYTREGLRGETEIHIGRRARVTINPEGKFDLPEVEEKKLTKINELKPDIFEVDVIGRVIDLRETKEFTTEDGRKGKVASIFIKDETGEIRVSLWDEKTKIADQVKLEDIVLIHAGYTREGPYGLDLHVGRRGQIVINPSDIDTSNIPSLEPIFSKLEDLEPDQFDVNIEGRVTEIYEAREFSRENGSTGKVMNAVVVDETGAVRMVAWDERVEELKEAERGHILRILHGYTKTGREELELHLGRRSKIEIVITDESFPPIEELPNDIEIPRISSLSVISENQTIGVRGTILEIYERKPLYKACPNCYRKAIGEEDTWNCPIHGEITPISHMIFSVILDDGTKSIRANILGKAAEQLLGVSAEEAYALIEQNDVEEAPLRKKSSELVGKEIIAIGKVFRSNYTGDLELSITKIEEEIDPVKEAEMIIHELKDKELGD